MIPGTFKLDWIPEWNGRGGYIRYAEGARRLDIYVEPSANRKYDILVWVEKIRDWSLPEGESIPEDKRSEIIAALRRWLSAQNLRFDF